MRDLFDEFRWTGLIWREDANRTLPPYADVAARVRGQRPTPLEAAAGAFVTVRR